MRLDTSPEHPTIEEILRSRPKAALALLRSGFLCVGCPANAFHTLADACREHDVSPSELRAQLDAIAPAGGCEQGRNLLI